MGPQLADLIKQGKVKLEMRHFPISDRSVPAAEAVECAGEQGYWWAMHDRILQNQSKGVGPDVLKGYAQEMGLDTKAFDQCTAGTKYEKLARDSGAEGLKLKVEGTPTFFVNGRKLELRTWDDILASVKKELNQQ